MPHHPFTHGTFTVYTRFQGRTTARCAYPSHSCSPIIVKALLIRLGQIDSIVCCAAHIADAIVELDDRNTAAQLDGCSRDHG